MVLGIFLKVKVKINNLKTSIQIYESRFELMSLNVVFLCAVYEKKKKKKKSNAFWDIFSAWSTALSFCLEYCSS